MSVPLPDMGGTVTWPLDESPTFLARLSIYRTACLFPAYFDSCHGKLALPRVSKFGQKSQYETACRGHAVA
jgi:hypothetical protein